MAGKSDVIAEVCRLLAAGNAQPARDHLASDSAFWEIGATVDHLVPVTRGGADDEPNWMTTSMARNSAKMNWTLAELGWSLHPPGDVKAWDGLLPWFLDYADEHREVLSNSMVRQWHRAGLSAIGRLRGGTPRRPL